jgi:hypothetical protein
VCVCVKKNVACDAIYNKNSKFILDYYVSFPYTERAQYPLSHRVLSAAASKTER